MKYDFDSVLFPYNYPMMQNKQYSEDVNKLIELCKERDVAIQTIKSLAKAPVKEDESNPYTTWYKPLNTLDSISTAVNWVLSNPNVFLNSTGDIILLPILLEKASEALKTPSNEEMAKLMIKERMEPLFT